MKEIKKKRAAMKEMEASKNKKDAESSINDREDGDTNHHYPS